MRFVGLVLAALLVPAVAHADGQLKRRPSQPVVSCGAAGSGVPCTAAAPVGPTRLRVVPPPLATVHIDDGKAVFSSVSTPSTIVVPSGKSYGITAARGATILWSARVMGAGGEIEVVWKKHASSPIIHQTPPATPPPPAAPLGPTPMANPSFKALLGVIKKESFESSKMSVVKTASAQNYFTVSQVGRVLDLLTFDSDRLRALKTLRGRVIDPENGYLIASHFVFASSQKEAAAMFSK